MVRAFAGKDASVVDVDPDRGRLAEAAQAGVRAGAGDGVVPQLVKEAHGGGGTRSERTDWDLGYG